MPAAIANKPLYKRFGARSFLIKFPSIPKGSSLPDQFIRKSAAISLTMVVPFVSKLGVGFESESGVPRRTVCSRSAKRFRQAGSYSSSIRQALMETSASLLLRDLAQRGSDVHLRVWGKDRMINSGVAVWETDMSQPLIGLMAGLVFGVFTLALMAPMSFPDKKAALTAAFIERFAIGVVIGCVQLSWAGWLVGIVFGFLLSVPSAIITKAYIPIMIVGTVGGAIIGGLIHGWH